MAARKLIMASGGGPNYERTKKAIRLARHGCTNRPFYHIVVMMKKHNQHEQPIEQLGTYDPMPNENNEKLVSFNFERIGYWLGEGADISKPVGELLGLAGFLPIHPNTYMTAWRNRRKQRKEQEAAQQESTKSENSG